MKNFKIKYFVLALIIVTQWSCAVNDDIKDIDTAATDSDSFVFEKNMSHYTVDGKITNNHDVITKAAKGACNIHFDYTLNKVDISTTNKEFEKYKNANPEFKKSFETTIQPEVESTIWNLNNKSLALVPAVLHTDYFAIQTQSKVTLWLQYEKSTSNQTTGYVYFGLGSTDSDLTTYNASFMSSTGIYDVSAKAITKNINFSGTISNDTAFPDLKLRMLNDRSTSATVPNAKLTFKKGTTTVSSMVVTLGAKKAIDLPNVEAFDPTSLTQNN